MTFNSQFWAYKLKVCRVSTESLILNSRGWPRFSGRLSGDASGVILNSQFSILVQPFKCRVPACTPSLRQSINKADMFRTDTGVVDIDAQRRAQRGEYKAIVIESFPHGQRRVRRPWSRVALSPPWPQRKARENG